MHTIRSESYSFIPSIGDPWECNKLCTCTRTRQITQRIILLRTHNFCSVAFQKEVTLYAVSRTEVYWSKLLKFTYQQYLWTTNLYISLQYSSTDFQETTIWPKRESSHFLCYISLKSCSTEFSKAMVLALIHSILSLYVKPLITGRQILQ